MSGTIPSSDADDRGLSGVAQWLSTPWSRRTSLGSLAAMLVAAPSCARGQPRRDVPSIGLFRHAGSATIPEDVGVVQTTGFNRIGWGAARYVFDPTVDRSTAEKRPADTFYSRNGRGFRLAEPVPDVAAFGAVGDGVVDDTAAIQRAIDSQIATGGTVLLPAGKFRLGSTLTMRSGVNVAGVGAHYGYVDDTSVLTGSWLVYAGDVREPAVRFRSVQDISVADIGISGEERSRVVLIEIGSDNNPSTKRLSFQRVLAFGAELAVKWGVGNRLTKLEQCDEITFEQFSTHSCRNGFIVDAVNAADFSKIDGGSFNNLVGIGFDIRTAGFMQISNVAASFIAAGGAMFRISGSSADPIRIVGCQSEGAEGLFLEYEATNDQAILLLEGNVINQPVRIRGVTRIVSRANYVNSKIVTTGYVRWKSQDDNFAGINGQPGFVEQIEIGSDGQFRATSLKDAMSFVGRFLPAGFVIEEGAPFTTSKLSSIVTRKGIVSRPFVGGVDVVAGQVLRPAVDNGRAFLVVSAGRTGATEPAWPRLAGASVQSGSAMLKDVGPSAVLTDFQTIAR